MVHLFFFAVFLMFFLSGASALMYEVVWVRSLSLVFGGSHLAVTVVLSVFMGGLALGSLIIGRRVDRTDKPLRLYGLLELGIALSAVVFILLMSVYPAIYKFLARGREDARLYLSFIRVVFSVTALIVPTTFMGGTLPVLVRFLSRQPEKIRANLSVLYGLNTLGAVAGALAAGFYFLRFYSVSTTLATAIAVNTTVGLASILLQTRGASLVAGSRDHVPRQSASAPPPEPPQRLFPLRLVLIGAGVSGFCALGYEVIWTRVFTLVIGASVYGFTIMLVAFLTGIALGSNAFGLLPKLLRIRDRGIMRSVFWFGVVQVIIGFTALVVGYRLPYLSYEASLLRDYFMAFGMDFFEVRITAHFALAYAYMFVPAFFMGVAFPLAGKVHAEYKRLAGASVGEVMAFNTIGAILGAAASGFILVHFLGIGRALQILFAVNVGFGLVVILSTRSRPVLLRAVGVLTAALILFLSINGSYWRMWDKKYFAVFTSNMIDHPSKVQETYDYTDVLYYAAGDEAIVSSVKTGGGLQVFQINGRVEASDDPKDMQTQYFLGHIPMLLHGNPERVLVVGLGSGMTLGATSVYPGVEKITLVELEPKLVGVAKTFEALNHRVLENPRLKIVFNDGRNFLFATDETFDVITADPIHPWFRGAGYLYTAEYFRLAAEHLRKGGVMCQWLPIYELTTDNLRSVVRTFGSQFKYTAMWLAFGDAVLVGSNSPILIDPEKLERGVAYPGVAEDMRRVMVGSADDLMSYFVMGPGGMRAFGQGGILNTDDNLYLEFSAPLSLGTERVSDNSSAISEYRESALPLVVLPSDSDNAARWAGSLRVHDEAARVYDMAHFLYLGYVSGELTATEFSPYMKALEEKYPKYAPWRFLKNEYQTDLERLPRLVKKISIGPLMAEGKMTTVEIAAVLHRIGHKALILDFVDHYQKEILGTLRVPGQHNEDFAHHFIDDVFSAIQKTMDVNMRNAQETGKTYPSLERAKEQIRNIIERKVDEASENLS